MKFLITGGCGFIGRHLVVALVQAGHDIVVLDIAPVPFPATLASKVRLVSGSIADVELISAVLRGCDGIFHLAAISSPGECEEFPETCAAVNVEGTRNVFSAAARAGAIPVVYASSAAVYGEADVPIAETIVCRPRNQYGHSKIGTELAAREAGLSDAVPSIGLRLFNVFGTDTAHRAPRGVVSLFLAGARAGAPVIVFGDGEQSRDFIHVSDVVRSFIAAMAHAGCAAPVINICTGINTSLNALLQLIEELRGGKLARHHLPAIDTDIRFSVGDGSLAQRMLHIRNGVSLREGVAAMLVSSP